MPSAASARSGCGPASRTSRHGRRYAITLADHPEVRAVHYPGLSEHPQHGLATKQLRQYGTVLSFEVADRDTAAAFLSRLQIARVATYLLLY